MTEFTFSKEELLRAIDNFFSDKSRCCAETEDGLQDARNHIEMLIESLGTCGEDDQS